MRFSHLTFAIMFCILVTSASSARDDLRTRHLSTYRRITIPIVAFDSPTATPNGNANAYKTFGVGFVYQWKRRVITCSSIIDAIPSKHFHPPGRVGILCSSSNGKTPLKSSFRFFPIQVRSIYRDLDVALLETDADLPVEPLTRIDETLEMGAVVSVLSLNTESLVPTYFSGTVSAEIPSSNETLYALGFPVGMGAHGAPVFSARTGALLGMSRIHTRLLNRTVHSVNGFVAENWGSAIVIPVGALQKLLVELKEHQR